MELTNSIRKETATLAKAKYRRESGMFVAEGTKCVLDTLPYFNCRRLMATQAWLDEHARGLSASQYLNPDQIIAVKAQDIERMSSLTTPQPVMAVYDIPAASPLPDPTHQLVLALDRVQDPGNLGTIVRVCDWFGVSDIIASHDTADVYAPKVVQATMGAIARVRVHYCDLPGLLAAVSPDTHVYGTTLDGDNIYRCELATAGIIAMGNEGRGLSDAVRAAVNRRLFIPSYPPEAPTSESLNVAVATAVTLAEFRRRMQA